MRLKISLCFVFVIAALMTSCGVEKRIELNSASSLNVIDDGGENETSENPADKAVEKYAKCLMTGDFSGVLRCLPEGYVNYILENEHLNEEQYLSKIYPDERTWVQEFKANKKFKYLGAAEIKEYTDLDEIAFLNRVLSKAGVRGGINKIYEVEYAYEADWGEDEAECYILNINGDWFATSEFFLEAPENYEDISDW